MSRVESDREDLLREATALVERVELLVAGQIDPIVVGFRPNGAMSVFFGADPVYQFNEAGQLRRAYIAGLLYKAERGRLVALRRERQESHVTLLRSELGDDQTQALFADLAGNLNALASRIADVGDQIAGQVPADADVIGRVRRWLAGMPSPLEIAQAPNAR